MATSIKRRGNCYVTSEAVYHLLGGKFSGYKPMRMKWEGDTHWFLKHWDSSVLDLTCSQFKNPPKPVDYAKAIGTGFLTKEPSKRARKLMEILVYQ